MQNQYFNTLDDKAICIEEVNESCDDVYILFLIIIKI